MPIDYSAYMLPPVAGEERVNPIAFTPEQKQLIRHARLLRHRRKADKLRLEGLRLYEPLPVGRAFHECTARVRLLDSSNQAGKTLAAEVELSKAICGWGGKYPKHQGRALIVGQDLDHLADPMWEKLAKPGAFSVIRDEHTRKWRSVRWDPNNPKKLLPYDEAYREKWRDAPPLVPSRFLPKGSVAWESAGKEAPRVVKIPLTGWRMLWRPGGSKAKRGQQIHLWWFDEEIENSQFLYEALRGCMRMGGKGFWSATPQTGGIQLAELREKADAGHPDIKAFSFFLDDNPYFTEEEKKAFKDSLPPDEVEIRYYGRYAFVSRKIYAMFDMVHLHGCEPFSVPPDWCRYVWLDPGTQHCGTVFLAVDPEEKHIWVYDAFDLRNADAIKWAGQIKARQGDMRFEAFGIDSHMGCQRPPGAWRTVAEQYMAELKTAGVFPQSTGPLAGFFEGTPNVAARELALIGLMQNRGSGAFHGTPTLQVMRSVCPELERQIRRAHYNQKGKRAREPVVHEDILVCLEYAAASIPRYHKPHRVTEPPSSPGVLDRLRLKSDRRRRKLATLTR